MRFPNRKILHDPLEQERVNAILVYLASMRIPFAKVRNTGSIYKDRFGRTRFGRTAVQQRGVADILVAWMGRPFAFEVKKLSGRASPEQKEWLDRFARRGGGIAAVVYSVNDVIAVLRRFDPSLPL